jgi:hypothetical protein
MVLHARNRWSGAGQGDADFELEDKAEVDNAGVLGTEGTSST